MADFDAIRDKMTAAGAGEAAIRAFERSYGVLRSGKSGLMAEAEIEPVGELRRLGGEESGQFDPELLRQTVVIKLNGGLGTGMGLQRAKSLLEVREGFCFLDIIVRQFAHMQERAGAPVQYLFMNSFSTSADTLEHLGRTAGVQFARAEDVELMQNQVPKLEAASLAPVEWPDDRQLEWCPPGHGDLYPALVCSGWLDRLLAKGVKYAFVSNSDNLGAVLDPGLLSYFAASGSAFMMEVTRRTEADKKGGHLARRKSDGRLVLREVAQCPESDLASFQEIERHRYFNTNNLWVRLDRLKEVMEASDGVMPLPTICNRKTVDPRDKSSTPVLQLETAMGAAIECFERAEAVEIPRTRFAPVKTTSDLLALRSDAYALGEDGRVVLHEQRQGIPPVVELSEEYKLVDGLSELGVPSLLGARRLTVDGAVRFGSGAVIEGEVTVSNRSSKPLVVDRLVRDEVIRNT